MRMTEKSQNKPKYNKSDSLILQEEGEKMSVITITLVHGRAKCDLNIDCQAPLIQLMNSVTEFTGVPIKSQKLICQGKNLTSCNIDTQTLNDLRVVHGSKIMVLGRKEDPEGDEAFKKIADIERKSFEVSQKFIEIQNQVRDIENGHLPREHHLQALKDLEKRCKICSESWMKTLETLDGIELNPDQSMAKNKRKAVANSTNANMDKAEEVIQKINQLRTKIC